MSERRQIFCLTPVKNEAWILPLFLQAASVWADRILIADQQSTDRSRKVCAEFGKVEVLDNSSPEYNEENYRRLPLARARQIAPGSIIACIDADEVFSGPAAAWIRSAALQQARPGSAYAFPWINVKAGQKHCWSVLNMPALFVDDGTEFSGLPIHSPRVPQAGQAQVAPVPLLHLQYLNWSRFESKQRWYQALERDRLPRRSAVKIYRTYHHLALLREADFRPFDPEWLKGSGADAAGLSQLESSDEPVYWWDRAVVEWFQTKGHAHYRRVDIWRADWVQLGRAARAEGAARWTDPRTALDRAVFRYLERSQPQSQRWIYRKLDRMVQLFWR